MAVRVIDRLEAVDVDEGDAQWLVVTHGPIDLGAKDGEEGLPVRDAREPVVGGACLDLEECPAGRVEGARQATLAGDSSLAKLDRLIGLERLFERLGDPVQAPADVAPRQQGHRRHPRDDGGRDHERDHSPLHRIDLRRDGHGDDGEPCDRERRKEPEEANEEEHVAKHGQQRVIRPWVDGPAVRVVTLAGTARQPRVRCDAVPDPDSRRGAPRMAVGGLSARYHEPVPGPHRPA